MALPLFAPKFSLTQAAYAYDFTPELAFGDIIVSGSVTVPTGINLITYGVAGNVLSAILAGGTPGVEYIISFFGTTAAGMLIQGDAILPIVVSV